MRKNKTNKMNLFAWIFWIIMLIYAFSLIFPLIWIMITSTKTYDEYTILENLIGIPQNLNLSNILNNYKMAWKNGYSHSVVDGEMRYFTLPVQLYNSLTYTLGSAIAATIVPCCTAYVAARYKFKFSKVIYTIVIITMVLPIVGSLPSEIEMQKNLGIFDTLVGSWIAKGHFLGTYFLIFYAQFQSMSWEYTEAARIDGASHFQTMTKVIMPLARNSIFTVGLLKFIEFWNDYQTPLVMLPSRPTLAFGMWQFSQRGGQDVVGVPMKVAYMVMVAIPLLILFICTHKRLMEGNLSIGGVKG